MKTICFLLPLFMTGCASYKIPIQTQNHPASSNAKVSQVVLSPLLEISESTSIKKQEPHVHP